MKNIIYIFILFNNILNIFSLKIKLFPFNRPINYEDNILSSPFLSQYNFKIPGTILYLGTPPQKINFGIATGKYFTWVTSNNNTKFIQSKFFYNYSKTNTIFTKHYYSFEYIKNYNKNSSYSDIKGYITLKEMKDFIRLSPLNNIPKKNNESNYLLMGILLNNTKIKYSEISGQLGLLCNDHYSDFDDGGYDINDSVESFSKYLFRNNFIKNYNIFGMLFNEKYGGYIVYDEKYNNNNSYCGYFSEKCEINKFYLDYNEYFVYKNLAYFYSEDNFIYLNKNFTKIIFDNFITISNNYCNIEKDKKMGDILICEYNFDINKLPEIKFELNEKKKGFIILNPENIFVKLDNGKFLCLILNTNFNYMIFGLPIFNKYKLWFDIFKSRIIFEEIKEKYYDDNFYYKKYCIITIGIISVIGIIIINIFNYKLNKFSGEYNLIK